MATLPRPHGSLTISSVDRGLRESSSADLTSLTFIDAFGLVTAACAISAAHETGALEAVLSPRSVPNRQHLATMGFDSFARRLGIEYDGAPDQQEAPASGVVVPLRSASETGGEQAISHLLWDQLEGAVSPQVLEALAEGIWEMVGNALEHSGADALVMAQIYLSDRGGRPPDHSDRVQVVIGDAGKGIRQSFIDTGAAEEGDDLYAITRAMEYLVTSVVDDPGRGQGLFTTAEQVAGLNGRMIIRSGSGRLDITSSSRTGTNVPPIAGVVVGLDLPIHPGH